MFASPRRPALAALLCLAAAVAIATVADAVPAAAQRVLDEQRVLGPGLYVFQTRLDESTCGQSSETGNVVSYYAAVDGVPGASAMKMNLINSHYWPRWSLTVSANARVVGDAEQAGVPAARRGRAHFELRQDDGHFVGRGYREYFAIVDGESRRCRMAYDALLRRIDLD